jgi:predicted TIM-barrel fold metal-dependent hydrolase
MLIDTDVHEYMKNGAIDLVPYIDPHWQRYLDKSGGLGSGIGERSGYVMPITPNTAREDWTLEDGTAGTDLDAMRAHLFDEEEVSVAILNGLFHMSAMGSDYEFAAALAAAYNDWQIENWLDRDPRLRGSVHVVAHDPEVAAREIDRVAAHPQIVQVFLPTVTNREYGDPFYRPILEAAVRNELVVALHHGAHTQTVLGQPRYFIEWHTVAAPQANMNQLLSLICNGAFDRYPELKVVILETGVAWVPWFMWRLDENYRELKANVPWLKRLPSEHMRDSVRVSTQPMSEVTPEIFLRLVEMADTDRMYVFSSDYPHWDADSITPLLPPSLPQELRDRIRYRNALETYPRLAADA